MTPTWAPPETSGGRRLHGAGRPPAPAEIERRKTRYFAPYHAALVAELERLRERHARVALYDCHSIMSVLPRLFDGELPVFNIGTNSGKSCDPRLEAAVARLCADSPWASGVNGRFTGARATRRDGPTAARRPAL